MCYRCNDCKRDLGGFIIRNSVYNDKSKTSTVLIHK